MKKFQNIPVYSAASDWRTQYSNNAGRVSSSSGMKYVTLCRPPAGKVDEQSTSKHGGPGGKCLVISFWAIGKI